MFGQRAQHAFFLILPGTSGKDSLGRTVSIYWLRTCQGMCGGLRNVLKHMHMALEKCEDSGGNG